MIIGYKGTGFLFQFVCPKVGRNSGGKDKGNPLEFHNLISSSLIGAFNNGAKNLTASFWWNGPGRSIELHPILRGIPNGLLDQIFRKILELLQRQREIDLFIEFK